METYIALFRGINVGGHGKLPMAELEKTLDGLGLKDIKTYIHSGNVVFNCEDANKIALADKIRDAIRQNYGFAPNVMLLTSEELNKAIALNPFPEAEDAPKSLHLFFMESQPSKPDIKKLDELKSDSERYLIKDKIFYLHAPEGIGRSKLAAAVEKKLGVSVTARNWRTVTTVSAKAR
ncbi:DUF1697 domain-containing protein [candidate division KSB1 bacterium]|nr:DUF1697 domain-containing protein [candidate division KSB1 bacterium]